VLLQYGVCAGTRRDLDALFARLGLAANVRVESLSVARLRDLSRALQKPGVSPGG